MSATKIYAIKIGSWLKIGLTQASYLHIVHGLLSDVPVILQATLSVFLYFCTSPLLGSAIKVRVMNTEEDRNGKKTYQIQSEQPLRA